MMRKLVRSGAVLTMCVVALSLAPTAARADKPVITKQRYEYTQVVLICPDFDVLQDGSVLLINSIFYANGQYVRNEVISRTQIDYINAVTGKSLSGMDVVTYTFTPDGISSAGLFLRITVPGQGAEALEAGRVVTDATGQVVFERGPFDSAIDLCGALD